MQQQTAKQEANQATINYTPISDYPLHFAPHGKRLLTIYPDGRIEWFGDQSEAAIGFWKCVELLCPWGPKEKS